MKRKKPTHNDRYSVLQEKYLKTRNGALLERMYGIAGEAARNYLRKYCRRKGIRLNNLTEKAHDAALFVIEQYLRKPAFKVIKISAYIHFGVLKVLFKDKERETREVTLGGKEHAEKDMRLPRM
jgi:hypothetical protein